MIIPFSPGLQTSFDLTQQAKRGMMLCNGKRTSGSFLWKLLKNLIQLLILLLKVAWNSPLFLPADRFSNCSEFRKDTTKTHQVFEDQSFIKNADQPVLRPGLQKGNKPYCTPTKTNIVPENRPSLRNFLIFQPSIFRCSMLVSGRVTTPPKCNHGTVHSVHLQNLLASPRWLLPGSQLIFQGVWT